MGWGFSAELFPKHKVITKLCVWKSETFETGAFIDELHRISWRVKFIYMYIKMYKLINLTIQWVTFEGLICPKKEAGQTNVFKPTAHM